jgi:hypothetical protein
MPCSIGPLEAEKEFFNRKLKVKNQNKRKNPNKLEGAEKNNSF